MLLTFELCTSRHGRIGRISLRRRQAAEWLTDINLLAGEFRNSLGIALANCLEHEPLVAIMPLQSNFRHAHGSVGVLEDA